MNPVSLVLEKNTRKQLLEHIAYLEDMIYRYADPTKMLSGHELVYRVISMNRPSYKEPHP